MHVIGIHAAVKHVTVMPITVLHGFVMHVFVLPYALSVLKFVDIFAVQNIF